MKGERRRRLKRTISILMAIILLAAMAVPAAAAGPEAGEPDTQGRDGGQVPGSEAGDPAGAAQVPESEAGTAADAAQTSEEGSTEDPGDGNQTLADPGAAGSKKVTISAVAGEYVVYQIFTGGAKVVADETGKILRYELENVRWGKNAKPPAGVQSGSYVMNDIDIENADQIVQYVDFDSDPYADITAGGSAPVEPGYYLIRDKSRPSDEAEEANVLRVIGEDITIKPKSAKPTVDKLVQDEPEDKDTSSGDKEGWGETADHEFYEPFRFKLIAQLPDDDALAGYDTYRLVFRDSMSKGVTFDGIESVKVFEKDSPSDAEGFEIAAEDHEVAGIAEGDAGTENWTLEIENLKAVVDKLGIPLQGARVEVIYQAYLNEDALVNEPGDGTSGETENKNTVRLEYSNNPDHEGTGETEEDSVWVFTYKMPNKKITIDDKPNGPYQSDYYADSMKEVPLGGAGFQLYRVVKAGTENETEEKVDLVAVTAPAEGEAGADPSNVYRPAKNGETGVDKITSDDTTGRFDIIGLDAGTYILRETDPPEGYNPCDDVRIVIEAEHSEDDTQTGTVTVTMKQNGKEVSEENVIVNMKGRLLPGTGGIGTTIFYTVGGVLAVGAAVLLIVRRRMRRAKKLAGKM